MLLWTRYLQSVQKDNPEKYFELLSEQMRLDREPLLSEAEQLVYIGKLTEKFPNIPDEVIRWFIEFSRKAMVTQEGTEFSVSRENKYGVYLQHEARIYDTIRESLGRRILVAGTWKSLDKKARGKYIDYLKKSRVTENVGKLIEKLEAFEEKENYFNELMDLCQSLSGEGDMLPHLTNLKEINDRCNADLHRPNGLYPSHAYTITDAKEIDGKKFIRLMNPWGNTGIKYDREALKKSTGWDPKAVTSEDESANEFWIELKDFCASCSTFTHAPSPTLRLDVSAEVLPKASLFAKKLAEKKLLKIVSDRLKRNILIIQLRR